MIYVLSDGQIQEGGTHQELLAHHELYYEMYTTQEAMYQDKGSVIEK